MWPSQGLAIGNGFMDPLTMQRYSYFVKEVGLVDDKVASVMNHLESAVVEFINNGDMLKAYAVSTLLHIIYVILLLLLFEFMNCYNKGNKVVTIRMIIESKAPVQILCVFKSYYNNCL